MEDILVVRLCHLSNSEYWFVYLQNANPSQQIFVKCFENEGNNLITCYLLLKHPPRNGKNTNHRFFHLKLNRSHTNIQMILSSGQRSDPYLSIRLCKTIWMHC